MGRQAKLDLACSPEALKDISEERPEKRIFNYTKLSASIHFNLLSAWPVLGVFSNISSRGLFVLLLLRSVGLAVVARLNVVKLNVVEKLEMPSLVLDLSLTWYLVPGESPLMV